MSRHPVDASRGGRRSVDPAAYRAGLAAGQAARRRGGCCLLTLFMLPLLLARHRDGPLGRLGRRLAAGRGDWHPTRDDPAGPPWPTDRRPPLADNLPKETP